ncbi:pmpB, partial [Symbiodinium pilosum]
GCVAAGSFFQNKSSAAHFRNCAATEAGGALYVDGNVEQTENSSAHVENCASEESGGGFFVARNFVVQNESRVRFANCTGRKRGGGMSTSALVGGKLHFSGCQAEAGGGLHIREAGEIKRGSLVFEDCTANTNGGGILSEPPGPGHFDSLMFRRCEATEAAALASVHSKATITIAKLQLLDNVGSDDVAVAGNLSVGAAVLDDTKGVSISTREFFTAESVLDCTRVKMCRLLGDKAQVLGLRCPVGAGVSNASNATERGCLVCQEGQTQLLNGTNSSCHRCPDSARQCFAGHLRMESGLMVEEHDISRTLHCPNQEACPGGQLPRAEGAAAQPMCAEGYVGGGCTSCAEQFARADSSILACTACEENPRKQLLRWAVFLVQRTFLFGLSAMSALGAGSADEVKQSGVFLNQLMAFATVSTMMLTAAMQTNTAKDMQSSTVTFVFGTTMVLAEIASGGGAGAASSQCLLSYVGLEKTLWGAHVLDVVVAVALTSTLALKDSRVALVAGVNCFLPSILAGFGKYLVCYRLERDLGEGMRGLQCPFLPGSSRPLGMTQVLLGLVLSFSVALYAWVSLSLSKEDPLPPHVNFLTSKYQPLYALFEAERLVRKSLLMLIAAALPITASPALQMGCLGVVVLTSLLLYERCQPYHRPDWNRTESALLAAAAYMITMISGLLANESHWGHSIMTQRCIIISILIVVATASVYMSFRVIRELVRERALAKRAREGQL